ncbi:MAG TPA: mycofactocin-associated electron transfer flavoprotein alpha subunit [Streptosporangiaceae bacterium]|nr:mycofactocin-associated electron transfer flavoprotein alpha subunit [Streptosporangiaceae bacterium]
MSGAETIAVVPVREGMLPPGADETVAECGGDVLLIGSGTAQAAAALQVAATSVRIAEVGPYAPAAWAAALAVPLAHVDVVMLPGSADGRDLAPRLAADMRRPLWAGAVAVTPERVTVARYDGQILVAADIDRPAVVTLLPGLTGVEPASAASRRCAPVEIELALPYRHDANIVDVAAPTAETIDLAEAPRVFAGGAGLQRAAEFDLLKHVAARAGASLGATRVAVDVGWAPSGRQIGTTGVTVHPELYVAFGVSGAVQHVAAIGAPEHVISVNTDRSCPMMAIADLAVAADAPAVLRELAGLLGVPVPNVEAAGA